MQEEDLVIQNIFRNSASKFSDKIALQIKKENQWLKFTYKGLETSSLKVAAFLIKEGFKKGDYASVILENRPEWAIIYLGIMYAGLTCVPLDPQTNSQDLKNLIIDSQAKVLFCSYSIFTEKVKPDIQEHLAKIVVLDAQDKRDKNVVDFLYIESISPNTSLMPSVLPDDIASLIYTSGTTDKPKGVLLSHKNICSNFRSIEILNICLASDNMLSILPLYHTYAFMVTLIVPLFCGACVTYCASLKSDELSSIIKEAEVTILVGVPQLFSLLHKAIFDRIKKIPFFLLPLSIPFIRIKTKRRLGSLRLLVSGGARLQPKVGRDLSKLLGIKLIEGYGLTETSPVVTLNPPSKIKFGSVGKPIPDVEIKIFNPDKSGVGQVVIKGPNVMQGYFKRPDLTGEAIKEGWFYSGDLGYLDAEGYLFLTGREKEVIVLSSGKNIYPEELEEYYRQSPYIKEICILSKQEEKFGNLIDSLYAIVVTDLEYFRQKNETDIHGRMRWEIENLSKKLPSYKHIMGFTVIKEELPRTVLKKIKRYEIRQKYLEEKPEKVGTKKPVFSEEDLKTLDKDIAQKIINYISSQLNKPVYLDSHLEIDLGIDSLSKVELGLGLEALLNVDIPDSFFYKVTTIRELIINILDLTEKTAWTGQETKSQKNWNQILRELPSREILDKIRIQPGFLDKLLAWIFKEVFLFIFRIFWSLKIQGREFLPKEGPYLICPNHASYLDGFAIISSLPFDRAIDTFFIGYSKIFEHPLVGWAAKIARLISIDPELRLIEAMQAVSFVLLQKKIVCIFPEGHRSVDERIAEFKKGVGILIKELDIPVVPAYIKGSHCAWPRNSRLPRFYPLKVIFGQPVSLKELISRERKGLDTDDYEAVARALREEVLKLAC